MGNVVLSLPDDMSNIIRSSTNRNENVLEKSQLYLAIGLFVSQEISLARASELAGKKLDEFMAILKSHDIPAVYYDEDMLEDDLKFITKRKTI